MTPLATLPALIRRSPSGLMYFLYWAPFIALYQLTNRFHVVAPTELPFTWLDRAVPFTPWLLPVYVAYLPLFWWTVYRSENDRQANRAFYLSYAQLLLCLPFFLFYPVQMPRDLFYPSAAFGYVDAFWRWFDAPTNCFPSLHVANCLLFAQLNWRRRYRWATLAASLIIAATTVLVKQHYVYDVAGGALVYLAVRSLFARVAIAPVPVRAGSAPREERAVSPPDTCEAGS